MSGTIPLEQRLTALENEVADLKRQVATSRASNNWIQHVVGSFKDEPEFDEVLRMGREIRQADCVDAQD